MSPSTIFKQLLFFLPLILWGCINKAIPVTTQIGLVTASTGYPSVVRNNRSYILARESRIYATDVLDTDEDSMLQIRMIDDTIITLAKGSHIVIHRYLKKTNAVKIEATLTKGAIRTTREPDADHNIEFIFSTPIAAIRSDSHDFWASFGDRTLDVIMISGTEMEVSNRSGQRQITQPNYGIKVIAGSGPQEPILWNDSRISSAISSTYLAPHQ